MCVFVNGSLAYFVVRSPSLKLELSKQARLSGPFACTSSVVGLEVHATAMPALFVCWSSGLGSVTCLEALHHLSHLSLPRPIDFRDQKVSISLLPPLSPFLTFSE